MKVAPRRTVAGLIRTSVPQVGRYGLLRLDKNERCTGYPTSLVRAMLKGLSGHHLAAYPESRLLYEKVAKWHGIGTAQLAMTSGSELAIRYLFEAFLESGDEVVLLNPSFAMFDVYARLCGARVAAANFDREWQVDEDEILRRITSRTKLVALANPNNPTGTVLEDAAILAVLRRAARHGALVLVDEAYYHFYGKTMLMYLPQHDNLVVTRTFSKACGAAGIRLGYAIGHPDVIAALNKVQPIDHLNVLAIKVGEYLIDHEQLMQDYVKKTRAGQRYLLAQLKTLGLTALGGYGNFVLADLGRKHDAIVQALRDHRIHVGATLRLPFSSSFVRITAGPIPVMRRVAAVLRTVLKEQGVVAESVMAGRR
ncbi:MAG: histidinol-phosphate aminotransferase family protein [Nitrospirae bacterium]|nr:MAG: histidinol-phosphate aminotransferase family protein [Nitrospirota bacterium]